MSNFDKWKLYYDKKWASKTQLNTVVKLGALTPEEYEEITGEAYVQ